MVFTTITINKHFADGSEFTSDPSDFISNASDSLSDAPESLAGIKEDLSSEDYIPIGSPPDATIPEDPSVSFYPNYTTIILSLT